MTNRPRKTPKTKARQVRFHAQQQTLRDFLGAFSVPDPVRNISEAKDLVDGIIKEIGAKEGVEHEVLIDSWTKIAGSFVAKHTVPYSLKHGVLTLRVVQPAMRFHLEEMKGKLLKNLQAELGRKAVRQVRFQLG